MSGGVLPMRLAVVIESFDLAAGGNERSTQQMMDELVARGHDVTLIAGACSNTTAALLEAQGVGGSSFVGAAFVFGTSAFGLRSIR